MESKGFSLDGDLQPLQSQAEVKLNTLSKGALQPATAIRASGGKKGTKVSQGPSSHIPVSSSKIKQSKTHFPFPYI